MASGYQINGTDLDDLCEPYVASKAVNSNGQDLSTFSTNGTAMTNRYQKANTDVWANVITLPLQRDGVAVKTVAKGSLPTQTKFAEITSAGLYNISRTDTGLTIGSTTYPASHFRNGVVPDYIGILICGGGGGAGGYGADTGDKNGYTVTPGGAGGGGGVVACVVNAQYVTQISIGKGGSAGANGSGDNRPSNGSAGVNGTSSVIVVVYEGNTYYFGPLGGTGGDYGRGSQNTHANSVAGGSYSTIGTLPNICGGIQTTVNGGVGGSSGRSISGGACSLTGFSFTTGAGVATSTMFNNSATGYSYSSGDSYRDSWAGGGCSIGRGATNSSSASYGGGGASGKNNRNGASGYCAFYY